MTSISKKDNKQLEDLYRGIYQEADDETTEGDEVAQAANIKSEVEAMEKSGKEVDPKLKQAATAADKKINKTIQDLTTD